MRSSTLGRRLNINDNWRFQREFNGTLAGAQQPGFDDSTWRQVNLPHDWSIELDFNPESPSTHEGGYLDGGVGWYRKAFTLPSTLENKQLSIDFDGVYMNSTTYLNGQMLGTYPFGYNAFTYDITGKVYTDGRENVLVVKVNNTQPSSRWYSGSGIYRNVYLTVKNAIHVERYGTFVTTPSLESDMKANRAGVNIRTKVKNVSGEPAEISVKSLIYDADGAVVGSAVSGEQTIDTGKAVIFEDYTVISNPKLWSTDAAYRYKLVTEVMAGGQLMDTYETAFGLRYFVFDPNEGFSLNGQHMKLHGVCMHHDLGALGAATNARAVERQMQIMKDMGVNAIRVTHNPASPELIEACNSLGLLVVEEAFDTWNQSKKTYDFGSFFSTWAEHDIKEMVDNHKNEPSIIMWSIGNEIYDTTSPSGVETVRHLVRWVKEIDTTRPTTIGEDKTRGDKVNVTSLDENIEAIFNEVDVIGLNYSENNYYGYHQRNAKWKLYGSETSSATRSRGVYTHPYDYNQSMIYADHQQSSYDNDYVGWGRTAEDAWKWDRDLKHIAGQFIWTGFDYIGEPTPYYHSFPSKSSYFGAVDTAGFPKDIFYYYQSQWGKKPMVHILPHWNWKDGDSIRVLVYTNAQKAELLLNGTSLGERRFETKTTSWGASYKETTDGKTYLDWTVLYKEGTLEAVAMDENDNIICRDKVETAGDPAAVRLTADRQVIVSDGRDLSFITADIVDNAGRIVPTANNLIHFSVEGNGELAGVDNGNAASIERYKDNKRKAFNGKALAVIQSNKQSGEIVVNTTSAGLIGDSINLTTLPPSERNRLVSAKLLVDYTNLVEDDILDLELTGMLESGEVIELSGFEPAYTMDRNIITIKNNKLYALNEGQVTVTATVMYEGVAVTTSELSLNILKNTVERHIVSIEPVTLIVDKGAEPKLPATVTANYNIGIPAGRSVTWEKVDQILHDKLGEFIVMGAVEETTIKAMARVFVKGAIAVETISMAVLKHRLPKLPQALTVYYNDGTEEEKAVRWGNIHAESMSRATEFDVEGLIAGIEIKAIAHIRVTDEIGLVHNISRSKNGYDYPKAEASFTNREPGSKDAIEVINDGVISYGEDPHNRWTNWQSEPRLSDWVSVTFGDFGPEEYDVDNLEVHWFEDNQSSFPASFKIQYKHNYAWVDVTNMQSLPEFTALHQANYYSFDRVKTSALRMVMLAKPGKSLAISEIKIFDKQPKANSEPKVRDILLDGESIINDFVHTGSSYECSATISSASNIPQITGIGEDNTSITVIPKAALSKATLIAKSEDGKKTAVYNVTFDPNPHGKI
ncbi:glycoside hydrolase family 2 TIM barrel-domain containing protein [Paenibacillus sp. LHD-38]|uniref:glycoside hydrolase family 2 TIM barrel-domain containing protein n=1 Tax=Paenibacillus sp. LHD-38 TaxID=3072143 RepID=UPI00280E0559|nr:glycoside hydrolase family 2 TIM barrel-domain containing protein [Paenibacillus sp. LHD-38]MDQ8734516.1 glycoside hydrolase family 2 TIM barrel-domain containing protein [Paenibacillus sp. LHD-38]